MLNEAKVLIIEEKSGRGQELHAILRFINQSPVLVNSQNWEEAFTSDTSYLAALVLSLIHISEPTRLGMLSRMPSSA